MLDEIRNAVAVLDRIAACLELVVGKHTPQAVVQTAPAMTPKNPVPVTHRQGEPVRAPVPQTLAARGEPPPAKRGPLCNATGPVFVGSNPIRCSEDLGHKGTPHSHAGYEWPKEEQAEPPQGDGTEPAT